MLYLENNPQWEGLGLRLYIAGKGCDGFSYGVAFDPIEEDDLCFPMNFGGKTVKAIIDPTTYSYLKGAKVQWVEDERGKGFVVENPRQKYFRGKFFKRRGWEKRLLGS